MNNIKKFFIGTGATAILLGSVLPALAEALPAVDFESYALGSINGQDGWTSTGASGSGCAVYDHAVNSSLGTTGFGSQSLRISNAVTSGCFGDQTFSKSLINEAGEADSTSGGMSGGTRQAHFEAQFDFASTQLAEQPGLFVSVSPDRGDGSRMSYLGFDDTTSGIDVIFYDVQGENAGFQVANFVSTPVATGLSRAVKHTAKFTIDYVNGPSNDVVKIYIDGVLVHTGTTWENYYRFDTEASAEQTPRTTDDLLFRTGGTAAPSTMGNGFLFDNVSISSGPIPVDPYAIPAECTGEYGTPIVGTSDSDILNGTNGNDLIFALGGSDIVNGKGGHDCIVGGDGSDVLKGGNGNDVILGGNDSDSIQGENGTDKLYGEEGSDALNGGDGADALNGGVGSDSLRGGNGADNLVGGDGSDAARGDNGTDTCVAESKVSCEL